MGKLLVPPPFKFRKKRREKREEKKLGKEGKKEKIETEIITAVKQEKLPD